MERVAKPGGLVLRVDVAPGWYGGQLEPVITGRPRDETAPEGSRDAVLAALGYDAIDFFMDQDYGSVERAVRTYGFIHGKRVIEHIREHAVTRIRWKGRIRTDASEHAGRARGRRPCLRAIAGRRPLTAPR